MRILRDNLRVGLQVKALIIMAFVVLSATLIGGIAYHRVVSDWTSRSQLAEADHLARSLTIAAAGPMTRKDRPALHRIATEFLAYPEVLYVSFVDDRGMALAEAWQDPRGRDAQPLLPEAAELAYARPVSGNCLIVARPVLPYSGGRPVGGIRITVDANAAAARLEKAQTQMLFVGIAILALIAPLGYVLVFRALLQPVRRLARATRQLADGDFSARAAAPRNDEIGRLAASFNTMAEKIDAQHQGLLQAKEDLAAKVRQRTTELDHVNTQLRDEIAERDQFLRAVSHDLNAPLRNIAGMATMIMMKWRQSLPEPVIERLERIQVNVDAQTDLINELLELARIRSRPQKRQWVNMNDLLADLRASFEYDLRQKAIDLQIGPGMPLLYAERNRLRQVFQNLLDNAIKYMPATPKGRIGITYESQDDEHVFHVADNGPGIAPEDRERIFVVFRRAAGPEAVAGKGVGLASVKTIVSNYNGRVWVNTTPGIGSTFHVALAKAATEEPARGPGHDDAQSQKISTDGCLVG